MSYRLPTIVLRPSVSRYQQGFLIGLHLLPLIGLFLAPLEIFPRLSLFGLLSLHAIYIHQRFFAAGREKVVEIRLDSDGEIRIKSDKGRKRQGMVQAESLVTPWLIILQIKSLNHSRARPLLLWPDMLPADELRQLKVLLRFIRTDQ